jgi:DNA-binding SARP family transcriptional activator/predicted ATPase
MAGQAPLTLRFLGEIEIRRGRRAVPLPQSKKTRALLAYLVLSGRAHRRERLCNLLWDVTDDPRGALRWSLSKLRALVDEPGRARIVADRDTVVFDAGGVAVDLFTVRDEIAAGIEGVSSERLAALASEFRGELLEGLELGGFLEFQAWCVAAREEARQLQTTVLRALIHRLENRPAEALPHARALVQADPLDEEARAVLVGLLHATGHPREAEEQYRSGKRVLEELGAPLGGALEQARRAARVSAAAAPPAPPEEPEVEAFNEGADLPLVGRRAEVGRLLAALDATAEQRRERVLLVSGEPGVGKSRLLEALMDAARRRGGTVLDGRSYEVEAARPYGPWVDALRRLPALAVGPALGPDLAPLLPELATDSTDPSSRDRLFGAVVEILAARAHSAPPVVLVLDDVQWCDDASATLLHYATRMNRHRPLLVALGARAGELLDNAPMCRTVRALRHDGLLSEIRLGPLGRAETEELVRAVAPAADGARVFGESGGNPLFAIEAARAPHRREDVSLTLGELVRERLARLPAEAAHVLRWGAVLGAAFGETRLRDLTAMEPEALVDALEQLERHALVRPADHVREAGGAFVFAHDVVRSVVYGDLSAPRRRLMHLRVAKTLNDLPDPDESIAAEIAHHAALAGEAALAARACVAAGRRCLRVFANAEAESLARRGMRHAEEIRDSERVRLLLELHQISVAARRPEKLDETALRVEELAEEATALGCPEHARLGFNMVSWLRWERGEWSDAQRYSLEAERVSRSADARERVVAMADAARCLALVERDLGHAEALLLEAGSVAKQLGIDAVAIPDGVGMLRLHQGLLDEARPHFEQARELARRAGDHENEFQALEHLVALEVECGRWRDAAVRAADLARIGAKMRGGSEGPFAAAMAALCDHAAGDETAGARLDAALESLRQADAKHRLAYVLTRAAETDLYRGAAEVARARASEALRAAEVLQCPSDIALARVLVARASELLGDSAEAARNAQALAGIDPHPLSAHARVAIEALLDCRDGASPTPKPKRRTRWKRSSSRESTISR